MYIQANIGSTPMSESQWAEFQLDVADALGRVFQSASFQAGAGFVSPVPQVHEGFGEWAGVEEESAHVSLCDPSLSLPEGAEAELAAAMSGLAAKYSQDAIALVGDVNVLVLASLTAL